MAEGGRPKDPVIINRSLSTTELAKFLNIRFRIRESDTTIQDSCIFPKAGVAFLLIDLGNIADENGIIIQEVLDRVEKFHKVHARGIVIPYSVTIDKRKQNFIFDLQLKFLDASLTFLPAHNTTEIMDIMCTQVQANMNKGNDISSLIKHQQAALHCEDTALKIVQTLNISPQESGLLLDGLGSISGIAMATHQQLMDLSLDSDTAAELHDFLNRDQVLI